MWQSPQLGQQMFGALSVFIILVHIAVQIRQNTQAIQPSANHASVSQVNAVRTSLYGNADPCGLYMQGGEI